jgi:hypothetical protein
MRRLTSIALIAAAAAAAGCGSDSVLDPVQTVDGEWKGTQNGYALSLSMVQSGTELSACSAVIGSNGGFVAGTCTGTFVYPTLKVTITVTGFLPLDYEATMSQAEAKLEGKLNGSGIDHLQVDIKKQ